MSSAFSQWCPVLSLTVLEVTFGTQSAEACKLHGWSTYFGQFKESELVIVLGFSSKEAFKCNY